MGRYGYSFYRNAKEPGASLFITTTVLDFVHAFANPKLADIMAACLLSDCRHYEAPLAGFVVMPHHLHLLVKVPNAMTGPDFMRRLKSNSARRILPHLDERSASLLAVKQGLSNRQFWMRGYRSYEILTEPVYIQKLHYIHQNPVASNLVSEPEKFRWSSARFRIDGRVCDDALVINDDMISQFCDPSLLVLGPTSETLRG